MTAESLLSPGIGELTERFDPIACLDERVRARRHRWIRRPPVRYVEVQGSRAHLLIPLGEGSVHIGRGLNADLRLDESSVSRRHAILVAAPSPRARASSTTAAPTARSSTAERVQQADLRHGDVIMLGRVVLRYLEV